MFLDYGSVLHGSYDFSFSSSAGILTPVTFVSYVSCWVVLFIYFFLSNIIKVESDEDKTHGEDGVKAESLGIKERHISSWKDVTVE